MQVERVGVPDGTEERRVRLDPKVGVFGSKLASALEPAALEGHERSAAECLGHAVEGEVQIRAVGSWSIALATPVDRRPNLWEARCIELIRREHVFTHTLPVLVVETIREAHALPPRGLIHEQGANGNHESGPARFRRLLVQLDSDLDARGAHHVLMCHPRQDGCLVAMDARVKNGLRAYHVGARGRLAGVRGAEAEAYE